MDNLSYLGTLIPPELHGTAVMVAATFGLLFLLKTIVLIAHLRTGERAGLRSGFLWYAAWPGLNAREFFCAAPEPTPVSLGAWLAALGKTGFGFGLLLFGAPALLPVHELLAGWTAMIGIVFICHFGGFHLLALVWQRRGRKVRPLMNMPIAAHSLSDFWSNRWNLAFRDFAGAFVLRPLTKHMNSKAAAFGCFVFSGIAHEIVISLPANGGWGLPFAYFMLQGLGTMFERSSAGKYLGIDNGLRGWLFALLIVLPGAYFLFHPPFVENVILPVVRLISGGAL